MTRIQRTLVGVLLALGVSASFAGRSIAPPSFDDETTQTHQDDNHLAMALWLSTEMFSQQVTATMDAASAKEVVATLKGYAIFGIVDATLDSENANVAATDRERLRASARLQLGDRAPRAIVREADLPPNVLATVAVMKPVMAGMLGKFGNSMEFVVFNDADEHGNSLADPRGHLVATLTFDKETFAWHLPLLSLQPLRVDPATGDTFPADYDFSPFTGHKLETKK